MEAGAKILVLGADGFIGRHIAFHLRNQGLHVLACARRTARLEQMGFEVLRCDLTRDEAVDPEFWHPHLKNVTGIINAAGLLTGTDAALKAVHLNAPHALYTARQPDTPVVLLSAVGIDSADTPFARIRRDAEQMAQAQGVCVLRAGLVLGDTSYGGSSLARALAALPFVTPTIGRGEQEFNPIHTDDLSAIILALLRENDRGHHEIGGPERVTQAALLTAYRLWLGLRPAWRLPLPLPLARALGSLGDMMRLGPISRTSVAQLSAGVIAQNSPLTPPPRSFSTFLATRPAGTQDLWHARLYLMRPVLRIILALMWLISGLIGLTLSADTFLPLILQSPFPDSVLIAMARLGGLADLALAIALLRGWRPRLLAGLQFSMVALYTLAFSLLAPALWLLPLGGLLKNIPILALITLSAILEDER